MKLQRASLLVFVATCVLGPARADKPEYPGIWGIWGEPLSREGRPWYKGHGVIVDWRDIEPAENRFDWSKLDAAINDATTKGLYVMVMVYTGAKPPAWLYDLGVPRVTTDFHGESHFPFYLDPDFKRYFKRMIDRFAAHLDRELSPAAGAVDRAGGNRARYDAIPTAMAPFGAAQSPTGYGRRTNWNGMDDVGFEIHRGNYELYLHQVDPAGTSQGLWRVGPKDQFYGRFARRFDHASGRDAMYFNLEDGFFPQPLNGRHPIEVRVVYFDEGRGKWALKYDAVSNVQKTALEVTKKGSGRWQEVRVTLADAALSNRGPRGSDLTLVNLDAENDTFHLIEITRRTGDRKGFWGE